MTQKVALHLKKHLRAGSADALKLPTLKTKSNEQPSGSRRLRPLLPRMGPRLNHDSREGVRVNHHLVMVDVPKFPDAYRIGLDGWDFGFGQKLDEMVGESVQECIAEAFKNDPPEASLPFLGYGPESDGLGNPTDDPLMIYIALPLGAFDDCPVYFKFSFREFVLSEIRDYREDDTYAASELDEASWAERLEAFTAALQKVIDNLKTKGKESIA